MTNHSEETTQIIEEGYSKICKAADLKEKEGKRFIINDVDVAIYKVDGEIHAMSNLCPHQHAALIYSGFIEEGHVTCPAHGWQFNLKTGKLPTGGNGLKIYPVKVIEGIVYAKVEKKDLNW